MWDLIVSVPDHCLSFYFANMFYTGPINKDPVYHCYHERFSLLTEIDKEMSNSSVLTNI